MVPCERLAPLSSGSLVVFEGVRWWKGGADERRREWIFCPLRAQERRGQGVSERKALKVTPTGRTGTQEAGRKRTLTAKVFPHRQTNTGGGPGGRPYYIMQARQVGKRPKTTRSEEREHSDRAGRPEKDPQGSSGRKETRNRRKKN